MKTEDYLYIGLGIAGLAGIAYALTRKPEEEVWCEREGKKIPRSEWTVERCLLGPPPPGEKWCDKEYKYIPLSEWTEARCKTGPPPPQFEEIKEGETLPVNITEPYDGDYWWKYYGSRVISVDVTNPYSTPKKFYIYVNLFSFNAGNPYKYDEYTLVTLEPNETRTVKRLELDVSGWMDDEYYVFAAVRRSQEAVNYGQDMNRVTIGTSPIRLF